MFYISICVFAYQLQCLILVICDNVCDFTDFLPQLGYLYVFNIDRGYFFDTY